LYTLIIRNGYGTGIKIKMNWSWSKALHFFVMEND